MASCVSCIHDVQTKERESKLDVLFVAASGPFPGGTDLILFSFQIQRSGRSSRIYAGA